MEFPECKFLKDKYQECTNLRREQIFNSLAKLELPPKDGDCTESFTDFKYCYTEYMEKFILAHKKIEKDK